MSRNLLFSEYETHLLEAARAVEPMLGGLTLEVSRHARGELSLRYPSSFPGSVSLSLRLVSNPRQDHRSMLCEVSIDGSSGLPGNLEAAQAQLDMTSHALKVARILHAVVGNVEVWLHDAPCDFCSGKGRHRGGVDCDRCHGKGVRNERGEAPDRSS